jgi:hypothetical protein
VTYNQFSIDIHNCLCYSSTVKNQYVNNNLREETLAREYTLKGTLSAIGIENLSNIGPAILHHHERWNGS